MSGCGFVNVLNRLRKSSSDSIDNINEFDSFKEYMHVVRDVEIDLKEILRKVNSTGRKTLVLLCGSAGDGKSHLLSYLKNCDDEKLLENYMVYNDATESNAPNKTATDTLHEVLSGFSDENLFAEGKSIILAINLGVLSNFIESQYGGEFTKLRQYVFEKNILSSSVDNSTYDTDGHFQHISFSDYHMFLLEKECVNPEYVNKVFERIVNVSEANPFYQAYRDKCRACPLGIKCPIRMNYEFFGIESVRKYIAMLLVNVIVREKEILTTRELLNYCYDIIVGTNFDYSRYLKSMPNSAKFLKEYLGCIMPTILFDCNDVTVIMNKTHQFDPLLVRNEEADDLAVEYYIADDVAKMIDKLMPFEEAPYSSILKDPKIEEIINSDKDLKSKLFNCLVRLNAIMSGDIADKTFSKFIRDLFNFNAGKVSKLNGLYSDVEDAITKWCGNESDGDICIDDRNSAFALYENIKFDAYLEEIPEESSEDRLRKFLPYIVVGFQDSKGNPITIDVDYSLFELIKKINEGYVQTAEDRNNHADFISFINKILKTGSAETYMIAVSDKGQRAIVEKTKFGIYRFRVVR